MSKSNNRLMPGDEETFDSERLHANSLRKRGTFRKISKKSQVGDVILEQTVARVKRLIDVEGKHGPVKILMKDGKPV